MTAGPNSSTSYMTTKRSPTEYLLYGNNLALPANGYEEIFLDLTFDPKFTRICLKDVVCETCQGTDCTDFVQNFQNADNAVSK